MPASSGHAAALAAAAPSGVLSGAVLGLTVSSGAADDTDGASVAPAVAVSCKGSLPDVDQAVLQHAADAPGADEVHLAGSAQEVLVEGSAHLQALLLGS